MLYAIIYGIVTNKLTEMASEMFDKLDALLFLLLPELNMSVTTRCDYKVCPENAQETNLAKS